jgi:hypothetical protein
MIAKIYDRDMEYTNAEVMEARDQLNTIAPGVAKRRTRAFGRFEFPLKEELTTEQQATFEDWAATAHPDWAVVWR